MYKLINGKLLKNENPILTKDGYITNPTRDFLINEGYKDLIDNKPTYDDETQYLSLVNHTEDANYIYANYEVQNIIVEINEIKQLKADLEITQNAINDLIMNML